MSNHRWSDTTSLDLPNTLRRRRNRGPRPSNHTTPPRDTGLHPCLLITTRNKLNTEGGLGKKVPLHPPWRTMEDPAPTYSSLHARFGPWRTVVQLQH